MTATYESIMDAALQLNPEERSRVATRLWESIGAPVSELDGDALESLLNEREAEMERDPSFEMSHQEFMSHFESRRRA